MSSARFAISARGINRGKIERSTMDHPMPMGFLPLPVSARRMAKRLMGLSFVAVNSCKQSITLDLKKADAKEAFLRLVEQSDVVLENFRPKVMERLGLGYEVLSARNPKIISCAISGFGQDGAWAGQTLPASR
ncbi:MAG: CoA transferase [Burkholderiales bacterium]|nr:CoA transferase [Burkholderiales bacterium]MCA3605389.1 CoA transferase [Methylobacterium sp.]MCA3608186.1 CoA transferase [Methylobacterium sp.]MCA3616910.1 CoA transferase [Methylobacterium sp.]MCA3621501.1 CoA transferase [Methylobacterium sp.]